MEHNVRTKGSGASLHPARGSHFLHICGVGGGGTPPALPAVVHGEDLVVFGGYTEGEGQGLPVWACGGGQAGGPGGRGPAWAGG